VKARRGWDIEREQCADNPEGLGCAGRSRDFRIGYLGSVVWARPSGRTAHAGQKVSPRRLLGNSAENYTEERVAPSRLRERARIGEQPWDAGLAACRVITIDEVAEWIEHDVLGDRRADGEFSGVGRRDPPHGVKREPEQRPVERVDRESGRTPASAAARHGFAEEPTSE
jgi:hypothetical protein